MTPTEAIRSELYSPEDSMNILDKLNEAGEALKATGLDHISITLNPDGSFSVGLKSDPLVFGADCFGFSDTPAVAYVQAMAKREPKARELAIRAEVDRQVRAAFAGEQREAA